MVDLGPGIVFCLLDANILPCLEMWPRELALGNYLRLFVRDLWERQPQRVGFPYCNFGTLLYFVSSKCFDELGGSGNASGYQGT